MQPADKRYEDRVVRISEMVAVDGVLDGFTFVGCQVNGPAVLILIGNSTITHCNLGGPTMDAVLWEIPPARTVVAGAIAVQSCHFEGCSFQNIGFAGQADAIALFRGSAPPG